MTNAQKVAWAEKNKVQPPDEVVDAAAREKHDGTCKAGGCCRKSVKTVIALKSSDPSQASAKSTTAASHSGMAQQANRRTVVVIGVLAEKCQGHSWTWSSMPWTIIVKAPEIPRFVKDAADKVIPRSEAAMDLTLEPPVPPPRCSSPRSVVA